MTTFAGLGRRLAIGLFVFAVIGARAAGIVAAQAAPTATNVTAPNHRTIIRRQRDAVGSAADRARRAAAQLRRTALSMRYNRVGSADESKRFGSAAAALRALAAGRAGVTMPAVRLKLGEALYGSGQGKSLRSAAATQNFVLVKLDKIIAAMHALAGATISEELRVLIRKEKNVRVGTRGLFQATLGEALKTFTAAQRRQLRRNAGDQRAMEKGLRQMLAQLAQAAPIQTQQGKGQGYTLALQLLNNAGITHMVARTGRDIRRDRLEKAQPRQNKIIALLRQALALLHQQQTFKAPKLYKRLHYIERLTRKERMLLQKSLTMKVRPTPAQFHQMQMQQQSLRMRIEHLHIKMAAAAAKRAQHDLAGRHKKKAQQQMRLTIKALGQQQQKLLAMLKARPPVKPTPGTKIADKPNPMKPIGHRGRHVRLTRGKLRGPRHGQWRVPLSPLDKKTLATGAAQHFPKRYRRILEAYYQNLAGGGKHGS